MLAESKCEAKIIISILETYSFGPDFSIKCLEQNQQDATIFCSILVKSCHQVLTFFFSFCINPISIFPLFENKLSHDRS